MQKLNLTGPNVGATVKSLQKQKKEPPVKKAVVEQKVELPKEEKMGKDESVLKALDALAEQNRDFVLQERTRRGGGKPGKGGNGGGKGSGKTLSYAERYGEVIVYDPTPIPGHESEGPIIYDPTPCSPEGVEYRPDPVPQFNG